MYEEYFGFKEKPFNLAPDPDFLYLSRQHKNALSSLDFGLMDESGLILFTGDIGTGKTTIIRHLLRRIIDDFNIAVVFNTNVTSDQLLELILDEFGINSETNSKARTIKALTNYLIEVRSQGKRPLLIIDEGQSLSLDALEEVRLLSNLQENNRALLQIMLVGQPELKAKLKTPAMESMTQRIAVNYHLKPFNREETGQYISHRIKTAGGQPNLFSIGAVNMIHQMTGGIPRAINILCHAALVYGFADEIPLIGTQILEEIKEDTGDSGLGIDRWFDDDIGEEKEIDDYKPANKASEPAPPKGSKVQGELDKRIEALEYRVEEYTKELRDTVRVILAKERLRNDKLLMAFAQLKSKYEILQKELANNNHAPEEPVNRDHPIKPLRREIPFSIVAEQKTFKGQD